MEPRPRDPGDPMERAPTEPAAGTTMQAQAGSSTESGAPAAAAFFRRQPAWQPLLQQARSVYERLGRIGGTIVVATDDDAACLALGGLLGRDPRIRGKRRGIMTRSAVVRVALAELDQALRKSNFRCGLLEALQAYFQEPLEARPERRAREADSWQAFVREAASWFVDERGRRWWQSLAAGEAPGALVVRRAWNRGAEARAELRRAVRHVALALNEVPALRREPAGPGVTRPRAAGSGAAFPGRNRIEPLAVFAHRVCGDPHALDASTLAGRLLEKALRALLPGGDRLERGLASPALMRSLLLEAAGLATDDISSTVSAFNLRAALPITGTGYGEDAAPLEEPSPTHALSSSPGETCADDPVATAACRTGTVLVWPLREIRRRLRFYATGGAAYVVENPQVFQALVDRVTRLSPSDLPVEARPTLICTSGQLSLAAILLLDRLTGRHSSNEQAERSPLPPVLYYGGDFDVAGLEIAFNVVTRYGDRVRLWRMTAADYRHALATQVGPESGPRFDAAERHRLQRLRDRGFLPDLIDEMLATGRAAYQEGLLDRLVADLLGSEPAKPGDFVREV